MTSTEYRYDDDIIISPNTSILDATNILNQAHKRIVLIVGDNLELLGVVTDSNIRRAILNNVDFNEPVSKIMRERPVIAREGDTDEHILNLMQTTTCYQIPIVNSDNCLIDVRFLDELGKSVESDEPPIAVVMVGGQGTRLRPLTESMPKPMVEIGGKPILFTILDHLIESGVSKLYLALNYRGSDIRDAIEKNVPYASRVYYIEETKPLGTAGPLSLIMDRPSGPFIIMNGDLLTKAAVDEIIQFHKHERNVLTVALREQTSEVPFGVARVEGTRILSVAEKPTQTHFINAGIYVAEPYVIDRVPVNKHFDMTTLIEDLITNDLRVGSFPVHEYWSDIGTPEQLEQAREDFDGIFYAGNIAPEKQNDLRTKKSK